MTICVYKIVWSVLPYACVLPCIEQPVITGLGGKYPLPCLRGKWFAVRPLSFLFFEGIFAVGASPSNDPSPTPSRVLLLLASPPPGSGVSDASVTPARPASMAVSAIGRDHAMVTNLLEAVARGRASFAISLPTEILEASEGGPRVGQDAGIGVPGLSVSGSGSGSGSDGLSNSVRGSGSSEQLSVPTRASAATSGGLAEGIPLPAGTTPPSLTGGTTAAGSRQPPPLPPPPRVGAGTTPSEGPPSTGVTFQVGEPGADGKSLAGGLSAGAGGVGTGTGVSGGKSDGSTTGGGALTVTKYRSARSIDADIMATMVASVRPWDDNAAADGIGGACVVGASHAAPTSVLITAAKDGRDVYGPEMEWGTSAARGGTTGAGAGANDGVVITTVLRAMQGTKGGLRLSQLGRAVAAACRARPARKSATRGRDDAGQVDAKQELLRFIGGLLRSAEVFCVCDAVDVRFVCTMWQALEFELYSHGLFLFRAARWLPCRLSGFPSRQRSFSV